MGPKFMNLENIKKGKIINITVPQIYGFFSFLLSLFLPLFLQLRMKPRASQLLGIEFYHRVLYTIYTSFEALKYLGIFKSATKICVVVKSSTPQLSSHGFESLTHFFSITAWHIITSLAAWNNAHLLVPTSLGQYHGQGSVGGEVLLWVHMSWQRWVLI